MRPCDRTLPAGNEALPGSSAPSERWPMPGGVPNFSELQEDATPAYPQGTLELDSPQAAPRMCRALLVGVAGVAGAACIWAATGSTAEPGTCAPTLAATVRYPAIAGGMPNRTDLADVRKVVVQNLEKKSGLATALLSQFEPDVMLAQEINLGSESAGLFPAHHTSRAGYGTAIHGRDAVTDVRLVKSPYAETGGLIYKKTTVALIGGVQYVSFHGHNGQPFKDVAKLVAHVEAVLAVLQPGPALFAGDFNTWTEQHVGVVSERLAAAGFRPGCSWPYPKRDVPLDHAFLRGLALVSCECYRCESDHAGGVLKLFVE